MPYIFKLQEIPRVHRYSHSLTVELAQTTVAEDISRNEDPFSESRLLARKYATEHGYDLTSLWEQNIAWGELDSFRFVTLGWN